MSQRTARYFYRPGRFVQFCGRMIRGVSEGRWRPANISVRNTKETPNVDHWLVSLGLIAGFIASKTVNKTGEGVILDIVLGIVGAPVGGFLFAQFGAEGVSGFNIYSMFVAVIGAIVVLLIYHAVVGRRGI
jgi:uncharacterized membrane protein YeaQ/YmgE (transglycosylase-associated protein family)